MNEFYTLVTQAGQAVLLDCISTGKHFPAAKIAIGDSNGNYYEPEFYQAALKNQKYSSDIYEQGKKFITKDGEITGGYLYFDMQIPASEGDYYIREAGLFDNEGNLLAVAKYPLNYKQKASGTSEEVMIIEIQIYLSAQAFVQVNIDNSGNLATEEKLLAYQKLSEKSIPNGYASLDENGKVPEVELPELPNFSEFVKLSQLTHLVMPDYSAGISGGPVSRNTFTAVSVDSFVCAYGHDQWTEDFNCYVSPNNGGTKYIVGRRTDDTNNNTETTNFTFFVPAGWSFCCQAEGDYYYAIYPLIGAV